MEGGSGGGKDGSDSDLEGEDDNRRPRIAILGAQKKRETGRTGDSREGPSMAYRKVTFSVANERERKKGHVLKKGKD